MLQLIPGLRAARALAIAASLSWAGALPALAQDAMNTTVVEVTSSPSSDSAGEPINFTGRAVIKSRLAQETGADRAPTLVLMIDMSGVIGQGQSTGNRPVITAHESLVRSHAPSQEIEFPFPLSPRKADYTLSEVRTGVARFSLNVDMATGAITSAVGSVTAR